MNSRIFYFSCLWSIAILLLQCKSEKVIYGCDEDIVRNLSASIKILELVNESMLLHLKHINNRLPEDILKDVKEMITESNESILKNLKDSFVNKMTTTDQDHDNQIRYEKLLQSSKGNTPPPGFCDKDHGLPQNCAEALAYNSSCNDGIYILYILGFNLDPFHAYCMRDKIDRKSPAWTVIQRRVNGETKFQRTWDAYRDGFGDLETNFWLGLARLHAMTITQRYELWILLEDQEGVMGTIKYDHFVVGSENQKFPLIMVGNTHGNISNALNYHVGEKFTTIDSDNDERINSNCAEAFLGGWWYKDCHVSNLNGDYNNTEYGKGIIWRTWHDYDYSLKSVQMAIRPFA